MGLFAVFEVFEVFAVRSSLLSESHSGIV